MGTTSLNPRALLKAEALVEPVQSIFDQDLVMARSIRRQNVDAETITYWLQKNNQSRNSKREPALWDLGVEDFPEIRIEENDRDTVTLSGQAAKVRFSAKRLEFSTSQIDVQDAVANMFRGFVEKYEKDVFNKYTSDRSTAKGTEFDALHVTSEGSAGYATTGGHIVYTPDAGNEWNAGGDLLQQLRELVTVMRAQGRIGSLSGDVRISNKLRAYTDNLTFGVVHDNLRVAGLSPGVGSIPGSITVPSIYGIEIVPTDYGITTTGDLLLVDEGNAPLRGYTHIYDRLAAVGFRSVMTESGIPVQLKDQDESNGDASVLVASGNVHALVKPKYVLLAHTLLKTA